MINFKGLGELSLHQNRKILREEWWVGGSSLLRMGSVSLLQHSRKASLFLFLSPCLFLSPSWCSAILPSLSQQKSILKWDFPTEFFYHWEVTIFQRDVVRKVPFELNIQGFHCLEWTLSFWLMTWWAEPSVLLVNSAYRIVVDTTAGSYAPACLILLKGSLSF